MYPLPSVRRWHASVYSFHFLRILVAAPENPTLRLSALRYRRKFLPTTFHSSETFAICQQPVLCHNGPLMCMCCDPYSRGRCHDAVRLYIHLSSERYRCGNNPSQVLAICRQNRAFRGDSK